MPVAGPDVLQDAAQLLMDQLSRAAEVPKEKSGEEEDVLLT